MPGSKSRRVAFYAVTTLFSLLLLALLGFPLLFVVLVWVPESTLLSLFDDIGPADLAHRIHEMGLGVIAWAMVLGVVVQFRKPERRVAPLLQALAVSLVILVIGVIVGTSNPAEDAVFLVPMLLLAFLHPRARDLVRVPGLDKVMTGLVALAAVPWVAFAIAQGRLQRLDVAGDVHAEAEHWALMAGFAILVVLWGLIGASDHPGWRLTAWITVFASAFYGLQSILFSDFPSAAPTALAIAAIVWAVAYGVASMRRARVSQTEEPSRAAAVHA